MLDPAKIESRLREMQAEPDPAIVWDETCEGSARSLAVFVGPSPGGHKLPGRRPLKRNCCRALWNKPFDQPFANPSSWWSPGFRVSFEPFVQALFSAPFETAGKLIGRANMDWLGDPQSKDVERQDMLEGCPSAWKMVEDCSPDLVLPMDQKTFDVLRIFLEQMGSAITWPAVKNFTVLISDGPRKRSHRNLHAFEARTPEGRSFLMIKLPQHPARMFRAEYGMRCGEAVRLAAMQIASGTPVDIEIL